MQKRLYNLDGLRFLAAWIVLLCHIEVLKPFFGSEANKWRFFSNGAQLAVTFFFVLSGFLIAWLLLKEKKENADQRINTWRFYKKRIFRIWPLYYLLLLLVFFVLRNSSLFSSLKETSDTGFPAYRFAGYMLFLPNTTEINYGKEICLGQTWSLGVEEFFYLVFPLLISFTPAKKIRTVLFIILILFLVLSLSLRSGLIGIYLDRYRIYAFASGGIAASFIVFPVSKENAVIRELKRKQTSIFLLLTTAILVIMGMTLSFATQQFYSILFALTIFSLTVSGIRIGWLNHPLPVYLGKISYGIYMLHPLALIVLLNIWKPSSTSIITTIGIALAGTILTILLAIISYECYEKFFLRWVRRSEKKDIT